MQKKWFKAKNYGWGWTPATWQGWIILAVFIGFLFWDFLRIDGASYSGSDTLQPFLIHVFLASVVLIGIAYATGEKPQWRWGGKRGKNK